MTALGVAGIATLTFVLGVLVGTRTTARRYQRQLRELRFRLFRQP